MSDVSFQENELMEDAYDYDYHVTPLRDFDLGEIKKTYGDDWKEKLIKELSSSGDPNEVSDGWRLIRENLSVDDTPMLSRVFTDTEIAKSYDLILKDGIISALSDFSKESEYIGNPEVVENLKKGMLLLRDYVKDRETDYEGVVETDVDSLFGAVKVFLLYAPDQVDFVTQMMDSDKILFGKNIYDQVMDLEVKINLEQFDAVRSARYERKIFVEPHHLPGFFPEIYFEDPERDTSVVELEESINVNESLPNAEEAIDIATESFRKDMSYIKGVLTQRQEKYPNEKQIEFRALIIKNPDDPNGTPIMIIRPNLEFERRRYLNGDGPEMFHVDIFDGWVIEASRRSGGDRASLTRLILSAGGYPEMKHLYLKLNRGENGNDTLEISSGWAGFFGKDVASKAVIDRMAPYGIDKVAVTNSEEDQRLVEKMILEDEVNDYLAKQSEKLSRIMPPRSIGRYKKMARKLLTDPNPDKTSKAWEIFREYENIAAGIK